MKIIKPGNPQSVAPPWWDGRILDCRCGCRFQLGAEDAPQVRAEQERTPNGLRKLTVACPCCSREVTHNEYPAAPR